MENTVRHWNNFWDVPIRNLKDVMWTNLSLRPEVSPYKLYDGEPISSHRDRDAVDANRQKRLRGPTILKKRGWASPIADLTQRFDVYSQSQYHVLDLSLCLSKLTVVIMKSSSIYNMNFAASASRHSTYPVTTASKARDQTCHSV